MVVDHVALGEVEECIMLQQSVLEVIALHRRNVHVRSNATAAIHGRAGIPITAGDRSYRPCAGRQHRVRHLILSVESRSVGG